MGLFDGFVDDEGVRMIGIEAGGEKIAPGRHAARFAGGSPGVLQGTWTYILQDAAGNIELTHSVSAGLDYAAVGPELAGLRDKGRVEFSYATDAAALDAFQLIAKTEGLLPALESAHAIAGLRELAPTLGADATVIVNLSGRGDKDVHLVAPLVGGPNAADINTEVTR
jgi:tryptophan synthase beta chain